MSPNAPEVTDWSERHIDLEWNQPIDDGGSPIIGYHVEARLNSEGGWQLWETIPSNHTKVQIGNLNQGTEYQFRVIALNKAGKSNPSHPSRGKAARAQNREILNDIKCPRMSCSDCFCYLLVAPYIDARCLRDVRVVAGERVKFDVAFKGEPTPEITWLKDEAEEPVPVKSSKSQAISISSTERYSIRLIIEQWFLCTIALLYVSFLLQQL